MNLPRRLRVTLSIAMTTALVLLGTTVLSAVVLPSPAAQAASTCTVHDADDSCAATELDLSSTSFTMTFTVQPNNAVFDWTVQPSTSQYNTGTAQSITCPGKPAISGTFSVLANGSPLTCTATWSWSSADGSGYPYQSG